MKERLEDLRKRSAALHDGIAQVDVDRAGAERLSRRLRPKVEGLANDAGAIAKDNEEVRAKLAEEQSPTFPWILEKNGADLDHVRELLAARDAETGEFVQVLADDVVTRYERLLQALDDELKRRADAMKKKQDEQQDDQQQDGGAQQRPSLVPPVAELLLLKRLEQDVLEDIRATRVEFREQPDGELLAARQRLLERLGHRHTELTDMFDKLVQQQTEPDQPKEGEGEGDGEQGKDKAKEGEGEGGKR
jgi:hypothetical protein